MKRRTVNKEGMIKVRNVFIPAIQVEQIEQEFGSELVPDIEADLLIALDRTLQEFKLDKKREPDIVVLSDHPGEFFKHMVLNISFLGAEIPGAYNKPAWFRFRKQYLGKDFNTN